MVRDDSTRDLMHMHSSACPFDNNSHSSQILLAHPDCGVSISR